MELRVSIRKLLSRLRRLRFGLREMFISTAFFALAIGIVSFNNSLRGYDLDLRHTLFLLAIPAVGAAVGAACGVLWHSTKRASIVGAIGASVIMALLFAYAKFHDSIWPPAPIVPRTNQPFIR
jgi:hypothetical protein